MKLETFFEKFDQFADAPGAVAKMREWVPNLSANGAAHTSLGQRPRKTVTPLRQALKGRNIGPIGNTTGMLNDGGWAAPSGLHLFFNAIPRALPWAGIGRALGAPNPRPDGALHGSLGQRPRNMVPHSSTARKGRPNA